MLGGQRSVSGAIWAILICEPPETGRDAAKPGQEVTSSGAHIQLVTADEGVTVYLFQVAPGICLCNFWNYRKSAAALNWRAHRSEEHTSELQSLMRTSSAVFCLK